MTDTKMLTRQERNLDLDMLYDQDRYDLVYQEILDVRNRLISHMDAADAEIERLRGRVKELEKQRPSYRIVKLEDEETPPEEKQ